LTDVASRLFQVVVDGRNIGLVQMEGQAVAGGEVLDECGVGARGGSANAVLDVDYAQVQVPARCQLAESLEQEDRIGAARDGHAYASAGWEHVVARDKFGDAVEHLLFAVD
jgi:hypothetical protein